MLNLEHWLRSFSQHNKQASNIYVAIVAQARHPLFYTRYGVQDTATGRYELLVLHVAIVLAALRHCEPMNGPISRGVVEAFVTDMDDNLRELGVGDMSVPKRVKKASAGLLERSGDYIKDLKGNDKHSLSDHISEYFEGQKAEFMLYSLIEYTFSAYRDLSQDQADMTGRGTVMFPNPADHVSQL